MPHARALIAAALSRWHRSLHDACAHKFPQGGDAGITIEEWQRFERQELRESTKAVLPFIKCMLVLAMSVSICKSFQLQLSVFAAFFDLACFVLAFLWCLYLPRWFTAASENSDQEWWTCIICQSFVVSLFFFWAIVSGVNRTDVLISHRTFVSLFLLACMWFPNFVYLPLKYHSAVVSIQGALTWMLFHWIVGFLTPVAILCTFVLPLLEYCAYRFLQNTRWRLFSLAEKEKHARLQSDTLKQTLRGVLNVTFDASCELDETGLILHTSEHFSSLLGRSSADLAQVHLQKVAATPEEAKRVAAFLQQIKQQKQEAAVGAFCHPAVLCTVLKCRGSQAVELDVKLCCVPLPTGCTVYDGNLCATSACQRFFIGLQTVQSLEPPGKHQFQASDDAPLPRSSVDERAESESSSVGCGESAQASVADNPPRPQTSGATEFTVADNLPQPQTLSRNAFQLSQTIADDNMVAMWLRSVSHGVGDSPNLMFSGLPAIAPAPDGVQEWHAVFESDSDLSCGSSSSTTTESCVSIHSQQMQSLLSGMNQRESRETELVSSASSTEQIQDLPRPPQGSRAKGTEHEELPRISSKVDPHLKSL